MPDSQLAKEVTELIRDTGFEPLLQPFHASLTEWGGLTGLRKKMTFDRELLYVGAMFHDIGLTEGYRQSQLRFEVDGANAARDFLKSHGIAEQSVEIVWDAIALDTTPVNLPNTRSRRSLSSPQA